MDKKISQLTGATTPLTGTEELAIVQGGSTVKATAQDVANLAGAPYTSYVAKLSQSGTNNPTVTTVFFNNTGLTFSWVRFTTGIYYAQPVGIDYSKVAVFATNGFDGLAPLAPIAMKAGGGPVGSAIWMYTNVTTTGAATDGELNDATIEIRVYP